MDSRTARIYERDAEKWVSERKPQPTALRRLARLAKRLGPGARIADLGCGPGWYAAEMRRRGLNAVAFDLSDAMLREVGRRESELPRVRADLAALPIARESLQAAWALNCYMHLPPAQLPVALAHLHAAVEVGGSVTLTVSQLEALQPKPAELKAGAGQRRSDSGLFPGRLFNGFSSDRIRVLLECAGFDEVKVLGDKGKFWHWVQARRAYTLPDYVRPKLRMLVCGLNPSPYAAESGIPFGRPGNRFWMAAREAKLTKADRNPWAALNDGVGFSDIAKRTTRAASELGVDEYREGLRRLEDSVRFYKPGVVCFAGLEGWRNVADRKADPGSITSGFGGRPAYLMPSPSGRNAHSSPEDLARHLRRALKLG